MPLITLKRLAAIALSSLGLASCETTVTLPEPAHTPRIALLYTMSNRAIDTTSDISLSRIPFVSYSQRVFDTKPLSGRTDAAIEVSDASGTVVERFIPGYPRKQYANYYGRSGYYTATMGLKGQPGQTYKLRATLPGFEPVESALTMPAEPTIDNASFVVRKVEPGGSGNRVYGRLTVTLTDNAATTDHYLAFARTLDKQGQPTQGGGVFIDYGDGSSTEFEIGRFRLSQAGNYDYSSLYPYPDTDVNGRQFSLSADVWYYACSEESIRSGTCRPELGYLEVTVSNITADAYRFYQSSRAYYDTQDNPFAEPAPLSSNIKPGYGLFGAAADATYRIKLF